MLAANGVATMFARGYRRGWFAFGRYQDFMVNEVDTAGNVVRLTSLQPLTPPSETAEQPKRPKKAPLGSENGAAEPAEGA